jgi:cell division protein FtsI/penicillin-binding protein 2
VSGEQTRARRVFVALLACLAILMMRAGYIQVFRADEFADRAKRQHFRVVPVMAPRGRILDRRGRILAASYHSCSIAVDPQVIDDAGAFASTLAFLLGEPGAAPALARRITERRAAGARFAYLRRWVDRDVGERVRQSGLRGLDLREEPRRELPHGRAGAALIGLVGETGGQCGLERRFDERLAGRPGSCAVFRAPRGKKLMLYPELDQPCRPGTDLQLTIDAVLQQVAEEALAELHEEFSPKLSCAIVLDPHNGEVLALAGTPAFDPEAERGTDVLERLRIPAVQNSYPIGSVLKPLIAAWALTTGAVHTDQRFDCGPGHKFFGGRLLHDVKPNGVLDLQSVLVKSSNIGMAQIGLAMGMETTHGFLRASGFGCRTGIEIDAEQPGEVRPLREWTENYTLVSVSMGRELLVTPIQLACAYAALINGGRLYRPTMLAGAPRPATRVAYDPDAAAFVMGALRQVVLEGTGRRARDKTLAIAGKTGSSKIELKGHEPKYVSSFVGYAPAEDPRLLVFVLADDPQRVGDVRPYGGVVAAPAVRKILTRGLPLLTRPVSPGSGVRQTKQEIGKVRVAAVHWSSVKAEGVLPSAPGRNPDSADTEACRSERR